MEVTQEKITELSNLTIKLTTKLNTIKSDIEDLGWEYQRMTSSGKETYEELCKQFGIPFDFEED